MWSPRYIDAPILRDEDNGDEDSLCNDARLYFLTDANMNVTTLVDPAGDALERYTYTPYGVVTFRAPDWSLRASSIHANATLYTGRALDAETGLYFYRARYYSAELGRFMARDPVGYFLPNVANADQNDDDLFAPTIGNIGGWLNTLSSIGNDGSIVDNINDFNLYRYVLNNPTNATDPTGLYSTLMCCLKSPGALAVCIQEGIVNKGQVAKHLVKQGQQGVVKQLVKWGGKIVKGGKGSHIKVLLGNETFIVAEPVSIGVANQIIKKILSL